MEVCDAVNVGEVEGGRGKGEDSRGMIITVVEVPNWTP